MSEGLQALENIKENCDLLDEGYQWDKEFSKLFDDNLDDIEKELKALKIIKYKLQIELVKDEDEYFISTPMGFSDITKEEYDLLKEVLL